MIFFELSLCPDKILPSVLYENLHKGRACFTNRYIVNIYLIYSVYILLQTIPAPEKEGYYHESINL